jgi:hypothetical protein
MNTSEAKQAQIKTMANAGWPVARISENLKVSVKTVQRVLQNTSKGVEERAKVNLNPNIEMRAPQISSAKADSGIGLPQIETYVATVDPAKTNEECRVTYKQVSEFSLNPVSVVIRADALDEMIAVRLERKNEISSAKANSGIDQMPGETQARPVDPATPSKRVNVTAKLRAQVINTLINGEPGTYIGVAAGLNPEQLARIKKEYESAKAESGIDQTADATLSAKADPATLSPSGASQEEITIKLKPSDAVSPPGDQTCLTIMELQARRVAALKALIQQQNATGAYVRRALGFSTDQDEKAREKLRKQAATLIKEIETGDEPFTEDRVRNAVAPFVLAAKEARKPFEAMRKDIENAMRAEAQKLPVWSWWGGIRGCGPLGLAIIIGETGDLSNYATVSRVWKRLGLAVIGGKAQGRPGNGASAEDWISHGYNPRRRSALWTVGDSLIKGNETGKYRTLYLARKQIELDKATAEGREMSDGHRHRRAQRYMEKTLIADLWANWNGKVREEG